MLPEPSFGKDLVKANITVVTFASALTVPQKIRQKLQCPL